MDRYRFPNSVFTIRVKATAVARTLGECLFSYRAVLHVRQMFWDTVVRIRTELSMGLVKFEEAESFSFKMYIFIENNEFVCYY